MGHYTHAALYEDIVPGFRVSRQLENLPKYGRMWKFALVVHLLGASMGLAVLNVPKWVAARRLEVVGMPERVVPRVIGERVLLMSGCIVFVATRDSIGEGVFTLYWSWAVHGVLFLIFSQISHINGECMDQTEAYRKEQGLERVEWAQHELLSCWDYSCDSFFWAVASINLNQQACHHIFPSVHPCHYPALRRVFMPIAKKYGIDYEARSSDTFLGTCRKSLEWLNALNEEDKRNAQQGALSSIFSPSTVWGVALTGFYLWGHSSSASLVTNGISILAPAFVYSFALCCAGYFSSH